MDGLADLVLKYHSGLRSAYIFTGGTANDSVALASIAMIVSGPKASNYTAFTDTSVNGLKSKSLTGYYFKSNAPNYSGLGGIYTVYLRATNTS